MATLHDRGTGNPRVIYLKGSVESIITKCTASLDSEGRITELEEKIAGQRTIFNEDANNFNIRIAQVPANFVAGFMGLRPHPLYEAAPADREDVQVKFT